MRHVTPIPLVLVTIFAMGPPAGAKGLLKVSEIDIKAAALDAKDGLREFPVFALRFSPDGKKVAVIADIFEVKGKRRSRLMVIDLTHPSPVLPWYEIEFGIPENEHGRGPALNFGWTPSGNTLYAVGKVIHLLNGTTCDLPNQTVFIDDHAAVSARPVPSPALAPPTQLTFFDQACKEQGKWDIAENWLITDVSTDRSLLSVLREISTSEAEGLIVDALTRKVIRRWNWKSSPGGSWEFADGGNAVCQGGTVISADQTSATCRSTDSGEIIHRTLRNGDVPIASAAKSTRVVVSDYRSKRIPFDYEYQTTLRGRYVWDFERDEELASWLPESESYPNPFKPGVKVVEPFRFAISPDGQYVAQGGNGKLIIYKVEP